MMQQQTSHGLHFLFRLRVERARIAIFDRDFIAQAARVVAGKNLFPFGRLAAAHLFEALLGSAAALAMFVFDHFADGFAGPMAGQRAVRSFLWNGTTILIGVGALVADVGVDAAWPDY
jgi:hypothetical protein